MLCRPFAPRAARTKKPHYVLNFSDRIFRHFFIIVRVLKEKSGEVNLL
jgi:hypothetical protein